MPNKIIEKGGIMKSKIQFINNKPLINVDEKLHPPLAFTTYFDECGKWSDFIKNGYKMFFVNVLNNNILLGNGKGKTKKEAEQQAAKKALRKIGYEK